MSNITDIKGVGDDLADELRTKEYNTVDSVANADPEELQEVSGVGESTATQLRDDAREVIKNEHVDQQEEGEKPDFVDADDSEDEEPPEAEDVDEPQNLSDTAESDDSGDAESQSDSDTEYTFDLNVNTEDALDYLTASLVRAKTERSSTNPEGAEVANRVLDELRGLTGTGDFSLTMSEDEINTLHSSLVQQQESYQGRVDGPFNAVKDLREQVDEVRSEHFY